LKNLAIFIKFEFVVRISCVADTMPTYSVNSLNLVEVTVGSGASEKIVVTDLLDLNAIKTIGKCIERGVFWNIKTHKLSLHAHEYVDSYACYPYLMFGDMKYELNNDVERCEAVCLLNHLEGITLAVMRTRSICYTVEVLKNPNINGISLIASGLTYTITNQGKIVVHGEIIKKIIEALAKIEINDIWEDDLEAFAQGVVGNEDWTIMPTGRQAELTIVVESHNDAGELITMQSLVLQVELLEYLLADAAKLGLIDSKKINKNMAVYRFEEDEEEDEEEEKQPNAELVARINIALKDMEKLLAAAKNL
jgi:hypothetical protein